jgi:hypothetical protein
MIGILKLEKKPKNKRKDGMAKSLLPVDSGLRMLLDLEKLTIMKVVEFGTLFVIITTADSGINRKGIMTMRDKMLCVLCAILLVVTFNVLAEATANDKYTKEAIVVEVEGNIISAEDATGNVWCYEVEGDTVPQVGTHVVLTMLAMGSDTIYDDQVVDVE